MSTEMSLPSGDLVLALKAAAEPTRLRILSLLGGGELNVTDLTRILGQSQPRLSRHLKLLVEAGLVERFREGSWVYFHLSDRTPAGRLSRGLLETITAEDAIHRADRDRALRLRAEREADAQSYFQRHAGEWDRIRALHIAEDDVETALRDALGRGPFDLMVDLGTGTGRILELFADAYARGLGIDVNQAMLAYARANLARRGLAHAQVRHGDIYGLPVDTGAADAVVMHQVLHYLRDPSAAIREAARILAPGGRLVIVDFAPHELEFLRDAHAHVRLGFSGLLVAQWLTAAGLKPTLDCSLASVGDAGASHSPVRDALTVSLWRADKPAATRPAPPVRSLPVKETTP